VIKILAFSYDEELREAFQSGLSDSYDIHLIPTLDLALEGLASGQFGAVITSALEPLFEGLDLMTEVTKRQITTPLILILGPSSKTTRGEALAQGFKSVLLFPFTNLELRESTERVLGQTPMDRKRLGRKILNLHITFKTADGKKSSPGQGANRKSDGPQRHGPCSLDKSRGRHDRTLHFWRKVSLRGRTRP
jgi:DNA-binding NtrC family response regulator